MWLVPFNYLTEQDHSSDFVKSTFKIIEEESGEPSLHVVHVFLNVLCGGILAIISLFPGLLRGGKLLLKGLGTTMDLMIHISGLSTLQ